MEIIILGSRSYAHFIFRTKVRTNYNSEDDVWNRANISAASINNVLMRLVSA